LITAIDLGYSTVKILQLTSGSSGYTVLNSGSKSIIDNLKSFDPEKLNKSNWVAAIQDLTKEMGINPKKVKNLVTSISGHGVSVKQISTMEMSEDEMINSLEFEARKHIPLDGSEPVIDFHMLGQDKKELDKSNVLLVSTTKKIVLNHHDIIKDSGFKPGLFDTDTVALTNCFIHNKGFTNGGVDVIIQIGAMNTTLIIWGENQKFFTRELPIAGHHITSSIMKSNGINYEEAENLKLEKGVDALAQSSNSDSDQDSSGIQVAQQTILNSLCDELRKTLRYYMKSNPQAKFNSFHFCGGSSNMIGLKDFISSTLKIELNSINPFEKITQNQAVKNPEIFAIVTGMAIRGSSEVK
jgi:type IV pilus assembly protein PilM